MQHLKDIDFNEEKAATSHNFKTVLQWNRVIYLKTCNNSQLRKHLYC